MKERALVNSVLGDAICALINNDAMVTRDPYEFDTEGVQCGEKAVSVTAEKEGCTLGWVRHCVQEKHMTIYKGYGPWNGLLTAYMSKSVQYFFESL